MSDLAWQKAIWEQSQSRILKNEETGCMEWQGGTAGMGYGVLYTDKKMYVRMHRLAWEAVNGPIPAKTHVLHTCDNPPCCNSEHLFLGTDYDNIHDMINKGRDNILRNKLHEEQVRYIRSELSAGSAVDWLAQKFDVTPKTIRNIRDGKTWSWLP